MLHKQIFKHIATGINEYIDIIDNYNVTIQSIITSHVLLRFRPHIFEVLRAEISEDKEFLDVTILLDDETHTCLFKIWQH